MLQHLLGCRLCQIRLGVSFVVSLGVPTCSARLLGNASSIVILVVGCPRRWPSGLQSHLQGCAPRRYQNKAKPAINVQQNSSISNAVCTKISAPSDEICTFRRRWVNLRTNQLRGLLFSAMDGSIISEAPKFVTLQWSKRPAGQASAFGLSRPEDVGRHVP